MNHQSYICLFSFLAMCAFSRTWTAKDGRETEAELIRYDTTSSEQVLQRKNGQEFNLNHSALSEQDIRYLKEVEKNGWKRKEKRRKNKLPQAKT